MTEGDVSSMTYDNIRFYAQSTGTSYRPAFGFKVDATSFEPGGAANGGHHYTRCDILGAQEGFDFIGSEFGSWTDCYADTNAGIGYRLKDAARCSLTSPWSAFNEKGISIDADCAQVHISGNAYTDNRTVNVPWGVNIDLEVEDGATNISIDRSTWWGARNLRADTGWATASNITYEAAQVLAEDGLVGTPGISFRAESDLGLYRVSSGKGGIAADSTYAITWTSQGIGLKAGAAATPGLYWNDYTNLGFYAVSSTKVGFSANGALVGAFDSQGMAFVAGSASAPGLYVNGDVNTGFFQTAADRIGVACGGNTIATFLTSAVAFVQPPRLPSYTVAGVPSAATAGAGAMIFVTNESGGAVSAFSDGTDWRRVTDRAVIS